MKRVGGAPTASAAEMGARGAAFSREQGRRTAAQPARRRRQRRPRAGPRRRPPGRHDRRRPNAASARPPAEVAATAVALRRRRCRRAGSRRPPSTSPASAPPARTPTSRSSGSASRRRRCAQVDEAPYRRFVAAGGEMVMLSTAIYPAFSPSPAAFARPIATGELRARLGFEGVSITDALDTVAVRDFGGPAKAGLAAARAGTRPPPLHRPRPRPRAPGGRCCAAPLRRARPRRVRGLGAAGARRSAARCRR